jgi:hypothetical protein
MNRRQFLATAAAASVAGCAGLAGASHHAAGDDAWSDTHRETAAHAEEFSGTVTLRAGAYTAHDATVTGSNAGIGVVVTTVERGRLDVFVFKRSDWDAFQAGEDVAFIESLTTTGIDEPAELISGTPAGDYVIAIANSPAYGSEPDGEAVADVTIAIGAL